MHLTRACATFGTRGYQGNAGSGNKHHRASINHALRNARGILQWNASVEGAAWKPHECVLREAARGKTFPQLIHQTWLSRFKAAVDKLEIPDIRVTF
jgi:hypothetical protein